MKSLFSELRRLGLIRFLATILDSLLIFGLSGSISRAKNYRFTLKRSDSKPYTGEPKQPLSKSGQRRADSYDRLLSALGEKSLPRIILAETSANGGGMAFASRTFGIGMRESQHSPVVVVTGSPVGKHSEENGVLYFGPDFDWEDLRWVLRCLSGSQRNLEVLVLDSKLGWRLLGERDPLLESKRVFSAFAFCDERVMLGLIDISLHRILRKRKIPLRRIITDNRAFQSEIRSWPSGRFAEVEKRIAAPGVPKTLNKTFGESPVLLWVGRAAYQKGIEEALAIAQKYVEIRFIFIISGMVPNRLKRKLSRLENCKLEPPYGEYANLISYGASAYLHTARWDGMPNIVLECLSLGIPVIAKVSEGIASELGHLEDGQGIVFYEGREPKNILNILNSMNANSASKLYENYLEQHSLETSESKQNLA